MWLIHLFIWAKESLWNIKHRKLLFYPRNSWLIFGFSLQLLIQISVDLVLCMLSFLMSETPTAISHLIHAISSLQEAGHYVVMETIIRLFLPLGIIFQFKSCHLLIFNVHDNYFSIEFTLRVNPWSSTYRNKL